MIQTNLSVPKTCSYACVYCKIGKADVLKATRNDVYKPEEITCNVRELFIRMQKNGEKIDYFMFALDGESASDIDLGDKIEVLKLLGNKIAVITNGSLIRHQGLFDELGKSDYVIFKIDTTDFKIWRKINRPNKGLSLDILLDKFLEFSRRYKGKLITKTMLIKGINTSQYHVEKLAGFIAKLRPYHSYLAIPATPSIENWVKVPHQKTLNKIVQIFEEHVEYVEYL